MDVFVARQPIFGRKLNVYAYELLYRFGAEAKAYAHPDGDRATMEVIADTLLLIGLGTLTGGKKAFINFTENLLKSDIANILPKDFVAIEILEEVEPNDEVMWACRKLKQSGYTLVLDDFVPDAKHQPFIDIADIIKIDFKTTAVRTHDKLAVWLKGRNIRLLAEKVETRSAFEQARKLGYSYFQGYFFSKPVIISSRDVPAYKINYLRIIQEVNRPDFDFSRLESIFRRDVSLSYKLLNYINSAAFGFRNQISSIKHALVMLGITEIKKWISLVALRGIAADKPDEIISSSLIRARFGELIAPLVGLRNNSSDIFLMGMFAMIDALIGRPMAECLAELPLADEIKSALLGQPSAYREVLSLIFAYEKGDWDRFSKHAAALRLSEAEVPSLYLESLNWANQLMQQE